MAEPSLFPTPQQYATCSDLEVRLYASRLHVKLRGEAAELLLSPLTADFARHILDAMSIPAVLAAILTPKLCSPGQPREVEQALHETVLRALETASGLRSIVCDMAMMVATDPAVDSLHQPFLFFKGFHALLVHRVASSLWSTGVPVQKSVALFLQARASELFGVDIHPAASIGSGVMLDHASGVVIGSTAVVGNDVYILHAVTLGSTGKLVAKGSKRHPTVGSHCVLGAGCSILGDVVIGNGSSVGAAAVVTRDVPPGCTVVGINRLIPARTGPTSKL
ncbi:hypothetical protein AB1Y20_013955 [Prymnesium parvum]|uniref:serine O-acetyltransferase n=1 Tax=Prymnesium parvum TaxID=97485 RepID=A0AB34IHG9_PRYPA